MAATLPPSPENKAPEASAADPDRPVNIVFVGAGAVGCFYASRLHHPQHNIHVSLIARSNYAVLARDGVKLQTHSFGDYTFTPHAVRWDFVIVTTKALPDRQDDSATIAPLVGPGTTVVLIQNGVGVEEPYRRRFPRAPIASGVTLVSAEQVSQGLIRQNRWTRMHLGPYTDSASSEPSASPDSVVTSHTGGNVDDEGGSRADSSTSDLADRGADAVRRLAGWWARLGGVRDVEALDEVALQTIRWHKLTINAAMNPSAVLSGGRGNADMVSDPELRAHLRGVMDEIWAAAPRVLGRPFPADLARPDRILRSTERNVGARPSMLLDWEAGRPLELEVILGNPVRIARAKGVELPRMQSLYALLKSAQAVREQKAKKGKL
ncbi:2-dehydropantoate 2-reductase [Pleurostoma richardsiae]|uniref:2-dehydropantoate 2-reductase n=1 Tax=Pleurostoma richardsiae TaxID=41990 RepID=A0AA38VBM9_9PEZI|nr:2-dehydropantoate 2-reductase [Pleurostoma richardsiae]